MSRRIRIDSTPCSPASSRSSSSEIWSSFPSSRLRASWPSRSISRIRSSASSNDRSWPPRSIWRLRAWNSSSARSWSSSLSSSRKSASASASAQSWSREALQRLGQPLAAGCSFFAVEVGPGLRLDAVLLAPARAPRARGCRAASPSARRRCGPCCCRSCARARGGGAPAGAPPRPSPGSPCRRARSPGSASRTAPRRRSSLPSGGGRARRAPARRRARTRAACRPSGCSAGARRVIRTSVGGPRPRG